MIRYCSRHRTVFLFSFAKKCPKCLSDWNQAKETVNHDINYLIASASGPLDKALIENLRTQMTRVEYERLGLLI